MSTSPALTDWDTDRGHKWRAQLIPIEATLAPVDGPLIEALSLDVPCRIADIGCGSGGTTRAIAQRAPAGSVVHGLDISPDLIEAARARTPAEAGDIAFHVADMETAAPPPVPYDRLTSRFGIMFFQNPTTAFANVAQWLAPGGRFAFAAWAPPKDNPWMACMREAVAKVVEVPKSDPDAPGAFRYASADGLVCLLETAGFGNVQVIDWRGDVPVGGSLPPEDAAAFSLAAFSIGEALHGADDDARREAHRLLAAHFAGHYRDGAVRMGARVHLVTGTRPQ